LLGQFDTDVVDGFAGCVTVTLVLEWVVVDVDEVVVAVMVEVAEPEAIKELVVILEVVLEVVTINEVAVLEVVEELLVTLVMVLDAVVQRMKQSMESQCLKQS